jgi:hypothetical protein
MDICPLVSSITIKFDLKLTTIPATRTNEYVIELFDLSANELPSCVEECKCVMNSVGTIFCNAMNFECITDPQLKKACDTFNKKVIAVFST